MPIVSSIITHNQDRGNNSRSVHEEHTDHLGKVHSHRYLTTLDHDVDAALIANAAKMALGIVRRDKGRVRDEVEKGVDPVTITTDHLTAEQRLRQIIMAVMQMQAVDAIRAAEFIDDMTDTDLDRLFDVTIRQRIRTRITGILALKTNLQSDEDLREELDPSRNI